jgi:carboxyl-terminal processing protease
VRRLLRGLEHAKVDGIVIDLRQNGGGSLQEAVELTGLFIKKGPVVQVRSSNGRIEIENDPDPDLLYDGPLAVLVDRFSASASEIFAGAIQDYGRGIVLGDPTFGKGTVQTLIDLKRFAPNAKGPVGQLKLTVAKFYRVNGSSTQHRGVNPDITFPSAFDSDEVGESSQDYALPWDEIKPIHHSSYNLNSLIPELQKRYQARTATDPVFNALLKDFVIAKQIREKTSVSLLMSQRKAEWEKTKAQQLREENRQRLAQGLIPLQEGEEIAEHTNEEQPDPLLDESARILVDMIDLLNEPGNDKALVMNQGAPVH